MELWTERQATQYLERHPLTGRDAARSALKAGIAGAPVQVRNALLYDADRVREAFARTDDPCRIRLRTTRPIFVARVAPRTADLETSRTPQPEGVTISRSRRAAARQRSYTRLACAFLLDDPGPWFDGQYGKRWSTGPGGPFRVFLSNGVPLQHRAPA